MQNKGQVWLCCLLGGIIGGGLVFAGHLQYHFSLWLTLPIGMLVGGGIAYLWHDIEGVKRGAARAYYEVVGWRPDWNWWWKLLTTFIACVVIVSTLTSILLLLVHSTITMLGGYRRPVNWTGLIPFFFMTLFAAEMLTVVEMGPPKNQFGAKYLALWGVNPIAIPIWIVIGLVLAVAHIPTALKAVWRLGRLCGRWARTAFRYIHSQGRLIVMVDTAIGIVLGVALGLWLDNPLFGTLACGVIGAVLGEINYRVVSLRWLKVVPA